MPIDAFDVYLKVGPTTGRYDFDAQSTNYSNIISTLRKLMRMREIVARTDDPRHEYPAVLKDWDEQQRCELVVELALDHPDLRKMFRREEMNWLVSKCEDIDFVLGFLAETDAELHRVPDVVDRFHPANRKDGYTHFHAACEHGYDEIVEKYLELGQDPNYCLVSKTGDSPLHLALMQARKGVAKMLLSRGADPNVANAIGWTPLHVVCHMEPSSVSWFGSDRAKILAKILFDICERNNQPVLVNAQDRAGNTPLHLAVASKNRELMELLLERGASPNLANREGSTPLHSVCQMEGDEKKLAKTLLELSDEKYRPVQVDAWDKSGRTPLNLALLNDNARVMTLLLERGADPNSTNEEGQTPLHVVCRRQGDPEKLVKKFLRINEKSSHPVRVDARDRLGHTPLHLALMEGNAEVAKFLLKRGANPNLANYLGLTCLHIICQKENDDDDSARMLFKIADKQRRRVEVDARDNKGNTPLHLAMSYGHKNLIGLLLRRGADPNRANAEGWTCLHFVCHRDSDDDEDNLLRTFLEINDELGHRLRIDARSNWGNTPLHMAMDNGHKEVAKSLLRRGADPNAANNDGETPLHVLCQVDDDEYHELLVAFFRVNDELNRFAQIDARDEEGDTPLHWALFNEHKRLTELLLRRNANPNLANVHGETPLHVVCKSEHDNGLSALFFEINRERHQLVLVDARDNRDRTPLQLAVAHLLPDVVDDLLANGADLADFRFPAESCFAEAIATPRDWDESDRLRLRLRLASLALMVVERLEKKGYELTRSDATTIMKFFAEHGLMAKSLDLDGFWIDDEEFASEAREITIKAGLSLYDLIRSRPKPAKRLEYEDYYEFGRSSKLRDLGEKHREACSVYLCEKLSRGFFRRWALDPFLELIRYRLPILCCEMIIERLKNEDLLRICLAADDSRSS
ncbi:hypothetical protein TKK_0010618 [Trichogramma kaykai]|uniref:Uncharacterized protein n=1 Tax=Trichogramma kaykai TaxID=54128 RepID=A0ABD2WVE2_9HYME